MRRYVLCSFRASDMGLSVKVGDLVRHTRNGEPFGEILVVTAQKRSETKNEFVKLSGGSPWLPGVCITVISATE